MLGIARLNGVSSVPESPFTFSALKEFYEVSLETTTFCKQICAYLRIVGLILVPLVWTWDVNWLLAFPFELEALNLSIRLDVFILRPRPSEMFLEFILCSYN